VTYYDDGSIRITSEALLVDGDRYPLRALTRVWHRRGRRSWRRVAGRGAIGGALLIPILTALVGLVVALRIDASAAATVALVGAACLVGLAAAPLADVLFEYLDRSYARGSRELQVWAQVQHRPVLLLKTDDAQRFGQIYRALQRALEGPAVPLPAGRPRFSPASSGRVARRPAVPAERPIGR
jgi:hypothetical protein